MFKSLFKFETGFSAEYEEWMNDLLKFGITYFIFNFLSNYVSEQELFGEEFLKNLAFLLIGLSVYHLVIKKSVKFE
jgi:hypothetical protein